MSTLLLPCVAVVSLLAQSVAWAKDSGVVLVDQGQPKAAIVWDSKSKDDVFFEELQPYVEEHLPWAIEQITGAKLAVVTNAPGENVPAIMIGKSWLPADAKVRLEKNSQRFDTRILARNGKRIYLAGTSVRGDAGAIADFIHDVLAVHMFGPDPIQWQFPKTNTLRVDFKERVSTPKFMFRRTWYDANNIPRRDNLAENYRRCLAINGGGPGMKISTSHSWSRVLPRSLFDSHPEYFAEVNGRRVPKQACISNPEVVERFVQHYSEAFEDRARQEAASISPNDGGSYCECPKCLAMSKDLSTRLVMFFNEVGRRLARKYPDRSLAFYAYAYNEDPPKQKDLRIEPNVIPVLAHYFTDPMQTVADAAYNDAAWTWLNGRLIPWKRIATSPHFILREYMGWWYGPWPMYRSLLASLRAYAEQGADGITREYQGRDLGSDLYMYLELRMTLDPYQDGSKLLDRIFQEYYGPAGFTARRISSEIEDTMRRGKIIAPAGLVRGYPNRFKAGFLREHAQALNDAKASAPEPYRSRLDRDIRYLECSAKYMDFVLPYAETVDAASKRSIKPQEIANLRRLLKVWLDAQAQLVESNLKGDGYLDRCIARDERKIEAWLDVRESAAKQTSSK